MSRPGILVRNVRETYHELGVFEFKVVLDPKRYPDPSEVWVKMVDSDGSPMDFSIRRWGTKLNVTFTVDDRVADGVASLRLGLGEKQTEMVTYWIIK